MYTLLHMQIAARLRRWLRTWLLIESDKSVSDAELSRHDNRIERLDDLRLEWIERLTSQIATMEERHARSDASRAEIAHRVKFVSESLTLHMQEMRADHNDTFSVLRQLISATDENFGLRLDGLSKRLIDLETDKPVIAKAKDDDDPLSGANSWAAQSAAAERGTGVRV